MILGVAVEMGLEPGRPYRKRCRHHHLSAAPPNTNPKTGKTEPSHRQEPRSTPLPWPSGHRGDAERWRADRRRQTLAMCAWEERRGGFKVSNMIVLWIVVV
jgi:hypothetical protein